MSDSSLEFRQAWIVGTCSQRLGCLHECNERSGCLVVILVLSHHSQNCSCTLIVGFNGTVCHVVLVDDVDFSLLVVAVEGREVAQCLFVVVGIVECLVELVLCHLELNSLTSIAHVECLEVGEDGPVATEVSCLTHTETNIAVLGLNHLNAVVSIKTCIEILASTVHTVRHIVSGATIGVRHVVVPLVCFVEATLVVLRRSDTCELGCSGASGFGDVAFFIEVH